MKATTTYTVHYPFGHRVETRSAALAERAFEIGLTVTARAGYWGDR